MLLAFVLLFAASGGDNLNLPDWAKYGLLGLLVVALATGQFLVPAYLYRAERDGRLAAEERERALLSGVVATSETSARETNATLARILTLLEARR